MQSLQHVRRPLGRLFLCLLDRVGAFCKTIRGISSVTKSPKAITLDHDKVSHLRKFVNFLYQNGITKAFLILIIILPYNLHAQTKDHFDQHSVGIQTSRTFWDQPLPEGVTYKPIVTSLYASWIIPRKQNRIYRWYLMVEPQWNKVFVGDKVEREIGVLPGLGIQLRLSPTTILFGEGGAGVKFITAVTARQARGFLFTDNFIGGIRQRLGDSPWEVRVHFRARHISNATLRQPNGGINNFFFGTGLYVNL